MLRVLGEGVALFLLPFAGYALLLLARQRFPFVREAWFGQRVATLTAAGLLCAIMGLIGLGYFGPRHSGVYRPAHLDNGRLIPGQLE